MKASDYIAQFIRNKGINRVFELSGRIITHILDSIHQLGGVEIITMHYEQAASFAADGYARSKNLPGVETFPFGFSDSAGTFDFYYDPGLSVNASLQNLTGKESVVKLECQVKTLDEFWAGRGEKADFIKCDVEGAELLVFRGGEETLRRDKPMVFSEMLRKWTAGFGYHPNDILDFFQGLGYRCFTLSDGGLKSFGRVGEDTIETNFFFLHPEVHSGAIQNHQR